MSQLCRPSLRRSGAGDAVCPYCATAVRKEPAGVNGLTPTDPDVRGCEFCSPRCPRCDVRVVACPDSVYGLRPADPKAADCEYCARQGEEI